MTVINMLSFGEEGASIADEQASSLIRKYNVAQKLQLLNKNMVFGGSGPMDLIKEIYELSEQEIANLEKDGLLIAGAGKNIAEARRPAIMTVKGKKVATLAYSNTFPEAYYAGKNRPGTAPGYAAFVKADVSMAREISDFVITSFHWGAELMENPKDYQRELARLAIDSGADLVLGHHPHILQGIEFYKEGVIFYSLGNFSFAAYSKNAKESIIAKITTGEKGIVAVEAIPINVDNFEVHFQPEILEGARAEAALSKLGSLSKPLGSRLVFTENTGKILPLEKILK